MNARPAAHRAVVISSELIAVAAGLVVCVFLAHTFAFRVYITDDAFIAFRYIRNLLDGHGLVYNPGERVWGYTSFLWVAALLPFSWAGLDTLRTARLLGVGCNLLALVLVLRSPGGEPSPRWARVAAGGLLVTNGAFVIQGAGGMETSLFTLLLVLALSRYGRALERPRPPAFAGAGALMALATMTRPEGAVLAAALAGHLVLARLRPAGEAIRSLRAYAIGLVPLMAAFHLGMFVYYGVPWPNSLDAKVGLSGEQALRGAHYLRAFMLAYPGHMLLLGLATASFGLAAARDRVVIGGAWLLLAFYALAGGDWMLGYRLLHPVIVLTCLLVPLCLAAVQRTFSRPWIGSALAMGVVVLCGLNLLTSVVNRHVRAAGGSTYVHRGIVVGKWMRENLPAGALLATNTAGTIPFYSGLRIVDMMGLNDRTIARRAKVPADWKGIEKGDGAYVLSRRPDYIQLGTSSGSDEPVFLSDIEIFADPRFWREYRRVVFEIPGASRLILFERRSEAGTDPTPEQWAAIRSVVTARLRASAFRY